MIPIRADAKGNHSTLANFTMLFHITQMRAELLAITFRIFRAGQDDDTIKDIDPAVVSRVVDAAHAGLPTH